jgi:hypothetical protein
LLATKSRTATPFFGAEVTLEQGNKRIGRYVVSVAAAPLKD